MATIQGAINSTISNVKTIGSSMAQPVKRKEPKSAKPKPQPKVTKNYSIKKLETAIQSLKEEMDAKLAQRKKYTNFRQGYLDIRKTIKGGTK